MTTSFYNGVSGLKSYQYGIDIWGDNIANISTTGYKESIPEFATLFGNMISTSPISSDIGMGSTLSSTAIDLSEGSLQQTGNPFDIAIDGKGWYAVKRGEDTYYSRTGSFKRDANGNLVDDNGNYLLVANANNLIANGDGSYSIDRTVNTDSLVTNASSLSPISLPNNVILPAVETDNVTLSTNLNDSDVITTTAPATEDSDFSALYSKDGEDLKIRNGDSLVFGFGNPATYENNLISTEICIKDDPVDEKDVNIDFTINGEEVKFDLPDGSSKEDIVNELHSKLDELGIMNQITDDGIKISDPSQIIISSNTDTIPNVAVAKLTYKNEAEDKYDFTTVKDFDSILQNLADEVYPQETQTGIDEEGRIYIQNNSLKTINAYTLKTENSNDTFLNNLGRLGNEIYAQTSAKSYSFLSNSQQFGGDIIEQSGQKDTLSFDFTKQKVLDNQILWNANITVKDPDSNIITQQNVQLTFDENGMLLDPKTVTLEEPQNININLNLTSYSKADLSTSYSYSQNGVDKGYLERYQIDPLGNIQAFFSNGKMSVLGQIPIYHFQNDQGVENVGGNLYRPTENSNSAIIFTDSNGNYIPSSKISSGMLEASNVNFSQAMTELIVNQKAYSSAAKTVTTSDQMIQTAINMKR